MEIATDQRPGIRPAWMYFHRALLAGALLILLTMVALAYRNWKEYSSARIVGLQVLAVQNAVEALISTLLDAETAQRGFLLTGETRYLEPYLRAVEAVPAELAKLDQLLKTSQAAMDPNLSRLHALVTEKFAELRETVELRREKGMEAAMAVVVTDRGKKAMDEIRSTCFAIRRQIAAERTGLQAQALAATRGSFLVTTIGSVILAGLLIAGFLVIANRTRDREEALARRASDLVEKVRADQALRESEERYRATFDNAAVGIAHVGMDGRWIRFNDAVCTLTGYSREELTTKTFADITHPDDIEADWNQARRVAAGEIATYSMEKRYIRKDGSTTWVNLTVSLIRDAGGRQQFVSVMEDIRERKLAEKELRTTRDQLQLVADNMAAAVTRCDRDLRYIWVSRSYADWLRRIPSAIIGQPIAKVIGESGFEDVRPYVERVLSGEKVEYTKEVNFVGPGQRWIRAAYVPTYGADETVDGWIAVVTDITDEKRSAEQQRQSQRLESLGVLAGGIAHDFNNILVGVLGNSSLALDMLGPATPAREMLENLTTSAERAAGLTRQLLAYAGKEQLTMRPLDLSALLKESTRLLQASIPKNVHLHLELEPSLPHVEADQTQLHQVIMNLVINAAEAIPENAAGAVTIRAAARPLTSDDQTHAIVPLPSTGRTYVAITVIDTGQGMPPEVQSRIFDPFYTTKFAGRGLGLSVVLGIIKAHQGGITLNTAPGSGTAITVLFPPATAAMPNDTSPPARTVRGSGTVLVIDDEETVREVARRTLRHHGYDALLAENGQRGIEVFRAHPEVIAIILDVAMPVMSGDVAAPQLRTINPAIPIILSSGYSEADARRKFKAVGATGFLQKPYRSAALIDALTASVSSIRLTNEANG